MDGQLPGRGGISINDEGEGHDKKAIVGAVQNAAFRIMVVSALIDQCWKCIEKVANEKDPEDGLLANGELYTVFTKFLQPNAEYLARKFGLARCKLADRKTRINLDFYSGDPDDMPGYYRASKDWGWTLTGTIFYTKLFLKDLKDPEEAIKDMAHEMFRKLADQTNKKLDHSNKPGDVYMMDYVLKAIWANRLKIARCCQKDAPDLCNPIIKSFG